MKKTRAPPLGNVLLVLASIVVTTVAAEMFVRVADDVPLFALPLPEGGRDDVTAGHRDAVPLAAGVSRDWFFENLPPLPNRTKPSREWQDVFWRIRSNPAEFGPFQPSDIFKAWNSKFAGDPCRHPLLKHAPGFLYVYDPPDGRPSPPYRFLPDTTTPVGLVTNQIGWRGPPIEVPRQPRTVRIVFVGASTTVSGHHIPYSYPEFVGYWLNRWAQARGLDVRFEALNAGRESTTSIDIAAEMATEILPLRPDLVVYYEGANQFEIHSLIEGLPADARPPEREPASDAPGWLRGVAAYSALARRVLALVASDIGSDGGEWPKPDYRLVWPNDLDEQDPDLDYPRLPASLNQIQRDLDVIRADLAAVDGELALSSFVWIVKDGMVVHPIRDRNFLEHVNIGSFPYRYRDIERLVAFENRVFRKYAATHGLQFIDVARYMPFDPNLFIDPIHDSAGGIRLRAWIVLQQLLPVIEQRLASGAWPRPLATPEPPLPTFTPRRIALECGSATK